MMLLTFNIKSEMMGPLRFLRLAIQYAKLCVGDAADLYLTVGLLHLPSVIYGPPTIWISQRMGEGSESESDSDWTGDESGESESESESETPEILFEIYVMELLFTQKDRRSGRMVTKKMNGRALRRLIDRTGRFSLARIIRYFPRVSTIVLSYQKIGRETDALHEEFFQVYRKVIDVAKRCDKLAGTNCARGFWL